MSVEPPPSPVATAQLIAATKVAAAASLAGGMIAASGRPWSLKEALELLHHCDYAIFRHSDGHAMAWAADPNRLERIYK
jgi:hypothetical protein